MAMSEIWNEEAIRNRALVKCIAFPFVLTCMVCLIKMQYFSDHTPISYLFFFAVFMLSAVYGGARAALWASIITFSTSISFIIFSKPPVNDLNNHLLKSLFYLMEVSFMTGLIYCLQYLRRKSETHYSALQQSTYELLVREKNHEDFVHVAAHELKSPVTILKAYIQLVEERLKKEERREDLVFVQKMDVQLEKLLHLIADLLDAARTNTDILNYQMRDFYINNCLKECIEGIKTAQPEFEIDCALDAADPMIYGDVDRIGQVINNLVSNAVKYAGQRKYIRIRTIVAGDQVFIEIEDQGIGIPAELQRHVFERFYRVQNMGTRKLSGSGLGLYISAEIIKKHDGQIGLHSEEGIGSVFWFSLPIKKQTSFI